MTLGEAIAEARKAIQMSQKVLAAMIIKEDGKPISPQYLNDIERDRRNPTGDFLIIQFARTLDVPEEYFFFLAHQIPPKYRSQTPESPLQVRAAFEAFARSYSRAQQPGDKEQ